MLQLLNINTPLQMRINIVSFTARQRTTKQFYHLLYSTE